MSTITEVTTFTNGQAAREHADKFLKLYAGAWNPYEGRVLITCDSLADIWTVQTTRNRSAD